MEPSKAKVFEPVGPYDVIQTDGKALAAERGLASVGDIRIMRTTRCIAECPGGILTYVQEAVAAKEVKFLILISISAEVERIAVIDTEARGCEVGRVAGHSRNIRQRDVP